MKKKSSFVCAPSLWPLAIYIAFVPCDNILNFSHSTTYTRLLGGVCAFTLLCALLAGRRVRTPPLSAALWAIAVSWMVATLMWTSDAATDTNTLITIVQLFGLYFVISLYPARESDLRGLFIAAVAGGALATLYGFAQYIGGTQTVQNRLWLSSADARVDPNHFAAALLLPFMIAVVWAMHTRKMPARIVLTSSAMILAVGIYLSASRGALVAAGIALVFVAWRRRSYVQLGAFAAFAGALSLIFPTVWYRFFDPTQADGAGRTWIWKVGLAALHDHWLVGSGIGTFPTTYNQVFLSVYQPISEGWNRWSHNLFVGEMVELGVIGLALILAAWFGSFRALFAIPQESRLRWIAVALEAALLALLVESSFLDLLNMKYCWVIFILVAVAHQAFRTEVEEAAQEPFATPRRTNKLEAAWKSNFVSAPRTE